MKAVGDDLILDRYRLDERLAVGGSAELWRAHDVQLDRPVAVKRLHPHLLPDGASRQRLVAEARAAARLSHPAIVGIYDVDASGESAAIIMELVAGESLAARIERDGPLPAGDAARLTADLAEALFFAHQQGVVHRDVKPGNVLLGADGRTRLVDFGIAHSLAASAQRLTQTGTVVGTLQSMAPEQLAGGSITPRTDLYGLGAVLHEALTGRPPYSSGSPVALAEAQRAGPPVVEGVDPALAAVVVACMAHDPADRPLHAGVLAQALRAWLAGDPSAAAGPGATDGATEGGTVGLTDGETDGVAPAPADTAAVTQVVPAPVLTPLVAAEPVQRRRRRGLWPIAAPLAAAALTVGEAVVISNDPLAGPAGGAPTSSAAVRSASPAAPTSALIPTLGSRPGWLAGLVEQVAEACGDERARAEEAGLAGMSRRDARVYADRLVDGCSDEGDG